MFLKNRGTGFWVETAGNRGWADSIAGVSGVWVQLGQGAKDVGTFIVDAEAEAWFGVGAGILKIHCFVFVQKETSARNLFFDSIWEETKKYVGEGVLGMGKGFVD